MTNQKIIFLDITCDKNHHSIKKKAVGASEYQFYNLIQILSNKYEITCLTVPANKHGS
jgi:hypothetical protein